MTQKFCQINDETLPKFIKRKKKQGARTKVQASKQPKRGRPQGGKGTTKNQTFHQSHEAYQLKRGKVFALAGRPN
jgi:hypothetical protein